MKLLRLRSRLRREPAYILILSLVVMACTFLLLLSLTIYSQRSVLLTAGSRLDLVRERLAQGLKVALEDQLTQNPNSTPELDSYSPPNSNSRVSLDWGGSSTFVPFSSTGASSLLSSSWQSDPTVLGYADDPGAPPPWHAQAVAGMPGGSSYATVTSTAFPYGAFAPWGNINVSGSVLSFANPSFKSTNGVVSPMAVKVAAGQNVEVDGDYTLGEVVSANGTISLLEGSGAIPIQGLAFPDPYTQTIHDQVRDPGVGAFASLSQGGVNKTDFISKSFLTPSGFFDLLTGKNTLFAIFSLQQACAIPMPVFPSFIDDEVYDIILLHNPYPSDFNIVPFSLDSIIGSAKGLLAAVEKEEQAVADGIKDVADATKDFFDALGDYLTGDPDAAKKRLSEAKDHLEHLKEDLQEGIDALSGIFAPFLKILDSIADGSDIEPPVTHSDDTAMGTTGWAYIGLLSRLAEDLGDFFKACFHSSPDSWNNLLSDLVNETRVIEFVDRNPLGGFDNNGGFTLTMTWTVPRGRTLSLGNGSNPDYTIIGDLWIQRGATMSVQGSLFVVAPSKDQWSYDPMSGNTSDQIPTGTIYLEEGATLIVDGNLYASGDADHGSVMVCSPAGQNSPMTTGIFCTGDVKLPYGTGSGVTLDRVLDYLVEDLNVSSLQGVADQVMTPILVDVAPHLGKALGPFHSRACWFSKYAVSLVIIPELIEFGLQGPWPIPLPYTNCWRNIFTPLSEIYEVELNFVLGDNLYTHADWWPFGQGVVPVLIKVDPKNYQDVLTEVFDEAVSLVEDPEQILDDVGKHMKDILPDFAEDVFKKVILAIVQGLIDEAAGGIEDPCGSSGASSEEEGEKNEIEESLKETINELLGVFEKKLVKMAGQILSEYRDAVTEATNKDFALTAGAPNEIPGVFVYSGGVLDIGSSSPDKAAGFFFAEGSVICNAANTFGSVVSRSGDITIGGNLYYYPFYSRASLWNPQKPSTYVVDGDGPSFLAEAVEVVKNGLYLEVPTSGTTVSVGAPGVWTLMEGPR